MMWTTLQYIKEHSRVCCDGEDGVLELYGASAEKTILKLLNRTYDDIVGTFGTAEQPIPEPIRQATLMLVDVSYEHRSPVDAMNLSIVPYSFDLLLKPYMRLAGSFADDQYNGILATLAEQKQLLAFYQPDNADDLNRRIDDTYARFAKFSNPSPIILETMRSEADALAGEVQELLKTGN